MAAPGGGGTAPLPARRSACVCVWGGRAPRRSVNWWWGRERQPLDRRWGREPGRLGPRVAPLRGAGRGGGVQVAGEGGPWVAGCEEAVASGGGGNHGGGGAQRALCLAWPAEPTAQSRVERRSCGGLAACAASAPQPAPAPSCSCHENPGTLTPALHLRCPQAASRSQEAQQQQGCLVAGHEQQSCRPLTPAMGSRMGLQA